MTPAAFETVHSELAEWVVKAGPIAETILVESGATPDCRDEFNDIFDTFLDTIAGSGPELQAGQTLTLDQVDEAVQAVGVRSRAAYCLGIAIGIRLAGGAR